jgi:plastocyanin
VQPGDTVVWKLSQSDVAPHTVSFLNGNPDLGFIMPYPYNGSVLLLINPAVLFPSQAVMQGVPLNNTDFFNSGFLQPGGPDTFSLKIGNISGTLEYQCLLHDTSGMVGSLTVSTSN